GPPGRAVNYASLGATLVGWHLPSFRGRGNQNRTCLGAEFSVLLKRVRDGTRATDHLYAIERVFVNVSGGRELRFYLRPIGGHLVCQNHWQTRYNTLPQLKPVHLDDDLAIRLDMNEGVRRINSWLSLASFLRRQRKIEIQGDDQSTRCSGRDAEKAPPAYRQAIRKVGCACHAAPPDLSCCEALLIAWRIRT